MPGMPPRRDPPSVSYKTQSSRWPPPKFLLQRPARKQVRRRRRRRPLLPRCRRARSATDAGRRLRQVAEFTKRGVEEHKGNYNIWYGKYESAEGPRSYNRGTVGTNPETRCVVATDVGLTKADKQPSPLICYLFAQGRCHHGADCGFLHRLPDETFEASLEHSRDCFGRPRHATDADGMGGVGNFMTNSRTLYLGNIKVLKKGDNLEKRMREHFGEWGELEVVKVLAPNDT